MKKLIKIIIILSILFLLLLKGASAIGISPSRTLIDFEPGFQGTYTYNIINWENPTNVQLYTSGELAEYITLSDNQLSLKGNEIRTFTIEVNLPEEIPEPGLHDTRIGVVEVSVGPEETTVGAVTGVESQFIIFVPYPGKYISARLLIDDTNINKETEVVVEINNIGQRIINEIYAEITIYDFNETIIARFDTNKISMQPKETKNLYAYWTPTNISAGLYKAKAVVYYDDKVTETERYFQIGDLLIEIINVFPTTFKKDRINKLELTVKSLWNEKISNVYADLNILKDGEKVASFKSEIVDIKPGQEEIIYGYLDTENLNVGDYILNIVLHFADKTTEKNISISIKRDTTYLYIIAISVLMVIIIVLIYFILRRKHKK